MVGSFFFFFSLGGNFQQRFEGGKAFGCPLPPLLTASIITVDTIEQKKKKVSTSFLFSLFEKIGFFFLADSLPLSFFFLSPLVKTVLGKSDRRFLVPAPSFFPSIPADSCSNLPPPSYFLLDFERCAFSSSPPPGGAGEGRLPLRGAGKLPPFPFPFFLQGLTTSWRRVFLVSRLCCGQECPQLQAPKSPSPFFPPFFLLLHFPGLYPSLLLRS